MSVQNRLGAVTYLKEHFPPFMDNFCCPCESLGINSNFPAKKCTVNDLCALKSRKPLPCIISICVFSTDLHICHISLESKICINCQDSTADFQSLQNWEKLKTRESK